MNYRHNKLGLTQTSSYTQFPLRLATKERLKWHLRGEECKTRESAMSATAKKMPSLQRRTNGL